MLFPVKKNLFLRAVFTVSVCFGCLCHLNPSILFCFPRKPEEDVRVELFSELSSIHTYVLYMDTDPPPHPPLAQEERPIIYM